MPSWTVQYRFNGRRCHARVRISRPLAVLCALVALTGAILSGGGAAVAAAVVPTDGGTLHLASAGAQVGDTIRFTFATATPDATNWIGVYTDPATVPSDGVSHGGSTVWTYVPATTAGAADLATVGLPADTTLTAVLLYHDGYQRLAPPITFTLAPKPPNVGSSAPTTPHFVTDDVVEPTTVAGGAVRRSVAGLWRATNGGTPTSAVRFAATTSPSWAHVSPDGLVTGTAPGSVPAHPVLVTVTAADADGVTGNVVLEFPIVRPGTAPALKAETLEAWDGGVHVDDPVEKLARSVLHDRIDLLALQDTSGTEGAALAAVLDWDVQETRDGLATLSPYDLTPRTGVPSGVPAITSTISVRGQSVTVWNAELAANTVHPAQVCTAGAAATITAERATDTYRQAAVLAGAVRRQVAAGDRVILLGALQSPSHLDWTSTTDTCGAGPVAWPVTMVLARAGLTDVFRTANPSVAQDPGSVEDVFSGQSATADPPRSAAAPAPATIGRTDAVDIGGPLRVTEAHTAVDGFPVQGSRANAWTSDRAAVAATLVLVAPGSGSGGAAAGGSGSSGSGTGAGAGGAGGHGGGAAGNGTHAGDGAQAARPSDPTALLAFTGPVALLTTAALALGLLALGLVLFVLRRRRTVSGSSADGALVLEPLSSTHQEGTL